MQDLCIAQTGWDEDLPEPLPKRWLSFRNQWETIPHLALFRGKQGSAPTDSIPRLALTAASQLARPVATERVTLDLQHVPIHLWTDSTVTLTWIQGHSSRWKDYVRNSVTAIHERSLRRIVLTDSFQFCRKRPDYCDYEVVFKSHFSIPTPSTLLSYLSILVSRHY